MSDVTLYHPEKYLVHVGNGRTTAMCTVWNNPEVTFARSGAMQNKLAIVGSLYSRQGVSVIMRNLALNPQIKKLLLWGNGQLSNTKFGLAGRSMLENLWRNGIAQDGKVQGTELKLEAEIDPAAIQKILANVELVDVSQHGFNEVERLVGDLQESDDAHYMEPAAFADPKPPEIETFPSEKIGWVVHGRGLVETWTRIVDRIMRYGTIKGSQYGYRQRELIGATWVVSDEDPDNIDLSLAADWPLELRELVGVTDGGLKEYQTNFLSPLLPPNMSYTYGNRIFGYPTADGPLDQVAECLVKQLKASIDSRRAVLTLLIPTIDTYSKEPPCITQIQTLQSEGKLHLLTSVRSHDIFKASISNASGLRLIQKRMAEELSLAMGSLSIASQSAHIYEQDWDQAGKLVRCLYWDREPSLAFDAEKDSDPRGMALIRLQDHQIILSLQNADGAQLIRLEGKTARHIAKKLAHLELLMRSDHMMDIAMELQKAEIALQHDLPYVQDRPLSLTSQ